MDRKPLEVVSLSKKEFDNQRVKPDNVLFFVYEEYISEDKKAKVRIRLYKGKHLICGDLYEHILELSKEIENLKENGGTGGGGCSFKIGEVKMLPAGSQPEVTNTGDEKNVVLNVGFPTIKDVASGIDLEIGRIFNTNSEGPEAEIVYDEETKKNKLNIGFPLRYTCISNNKEFTYNHYGVPNVKIYDLYPKELHERLKEISLDPVTQLLPSQKNYDLSSGTKNDFVFIEDYHPLDTKGLILKVAPHTPRLYRRFPDENMAIDYHKVDNILYPVIRGGSVYSPVHNKDTYIEHYLRDYDEDENKYTSPIYIYNEEESYEVVGTLYADKSEFHLNDYLYLKGQTGTIDIVFDEPFSFFDSLKRFWIRFPSYIPDKIKFQGINYKGEYYTLFDIETKQKQNIDFAPYGIYGIDYNFAQCVPIVYGKDMWDLYWIYNPTDIRKISLTFETDYDGDNDEYMMVWPWFFIRKGSFLDTY